MKKDEIKEKFLKELKELIDKTKFTNGLADMFTSLMSTIISYGAIPQENDQLDPEHKLYFLVGIFENAAKNYIDVHFGPSPEDG